MSRLTFAVPPTADKGTFAAASDGINRLVDPGPFTADYLRSILHYDPITGFFTWKARADLDNAHNAQHAGRRAGVVKPSGRVDIKISGRIYGANRLAWLYITGQWPKNFIDHKDNNPANDSWANLREADRAQNGWNSRPSRENLTSGHRGVTLTSRGDRWQVFIGFRGRRIYLGRFLSLDDAIRARLEAEHQYHGEFALAAQAVPAGEERRPYNDTAPLANGRLIGRAA